MMNTSSYLPVLLYRITYCLVFLTVSSVPVAAAQAVSLAARTQEVLEQRCYPCHGQNGEANKNVFVLDHARLLKDGVVVPGNSRSLLLKMVESGAMPPGGNKLPETEIQILHNWVLAGAPGWDSGAPVSPRKFLTDEAVTQRIKQDLEQTSPLNRRHIRYFSLAHLYNAGAPEEELESYRVGLSRLLNSLSWRPRISKPEPIDPERTILRIDLRNYSWAQITWELLLEYYPYGRSYPGSEQFQPLAGTHLPYVHADWFVARASGKNLYHVLLNLPGNVKTLESRLGVQADDDLLENRDVVRAGVRTSGVAVHNRVVERHLSFYGAYWKSYDFRSDQGDQNIFRDPLQLKPAGGEFIFNLPNGMQGYYVANGNGDLLDAAPTQIATDRNFPDQPEVINGRSCMSCHHQGMNPIKDEVRQVFQALPETTSPDRNKILALYPDQKVLDSLLKEDQDRFRKAVEAAGGEPSETSRNEPISTLARRFEADLGLSQAAAEVGLQPEEFRRRLASSARLAQLGLGQLLVENGGIKRDAWENYYPDVVREMHLNQDAAPTTAVPAAQQSPPPARQPAIRGGPVHPYTGETEPARSGLAAHLHFSITDLGTLGGASSRANSMNHQGQVVGSSTLKDSTAAHAFLWENHRMIDLGVLPGCLDSEAASINEKGQVVGFSRSADGLKHACLWQNGQVVELLAPDHQEAKAFAINNAGIAVGQSHDRAMMWDTGATARPGITGRVLSQGSATAINNKQQVVGVTYTRNTIHDFLWQGDTVQDLNIDPFRNGYAFGINEDGQVIGRSSWDIMIPAGHAYLLDHGLKNDLGSLTGAFSEARGINNKCQIVGYCMTGDNHSVAFLWRNGAMYRLDNLMDVSSGWKLEKALGINDRGEIVGVGALKGEDHAFLLTPVQGQD